MKERRSLSLALKKRRQAIQKWPVGFTTLHTVIHAKSAKQRQSSNYVTYPL